MKELIRPYIKEFKVPIGLALLFNILISYFSGSTLTAAIISFIGSAISIFIWSYLGFIAGYIRGKLSLFSDLKSIKDDIDKIANLVKETKYIEGEYKIVNGKLVKTSDE